LVEPTPLVQNISSPTYPSGDNISCFGFNDGSIDYVPSGGSPGYTYSWSNGATSQNLSSIAEGTYDVTMTDINGCTQSTIITLIQPVPLDQNITSPTFPSGDNISCFQFNDGSIDYFPSGGSPGYTYVWSTTDGSGLTPGAEDQTGLTSGTYGVTMTDINGCVQTTTITLIQPTPLTIDLTPSIYAGGYNLTGCAPDGWIDATVGGGSPGYVYSWNGGAFAIEDLNTLPAGNYNVTVTDINGCIITDQITLVQPPVVTVTTTVTSNYNGQDISCLGASDGAVSSTPVGGTVPYGYSWTNIGGTVVGNTQNVNGLPSGDYTVLVTDANGCTTTAPITLVDPPALVADGVVSSDYNGQDVSCFGATDGTIDLTINGGTPAYVFSWRDENGNVVSTIEDPVGLGAGTYEVTAVDANGCLINAQVTITEPDELLSIAQVVSDYNGADVSCFQSTDGSIDVTPTGGTPGYTYAWSNSSGAPIGTTQLLDQMVGAGIYNVMVTDLNGCTSMTTVNVTQPTPVTSSIAILSNYFGAAVSCEGAEDGSVEVSYDGGTPGYGISWNTVPAQNTDIAINMPEGTFEATVTDANGCISISTTTLAANPAPNIPPPTPIVGCVGNNITFESGAEPGSNCEWTFSDGTTINDCGPIIMNFSAQLCLDMQLVVTTAQGCKDTVTMADFLCIAPNPVASFYAETLDISTTDYDNYFYNTSVNGDSFIWDFGDGSPNEFSENVYHQFPDGADPVDYQVWLYTISSDGCIDSTSIWIQYHPELIYYVPNAFTPDGDDYNNVFKPVISSGYKYENYGFYIFNRWGELIYETDQIGQGWDGTYRGVKCQEGVYTWKLKIMNLETDRKEEAVGHVTLLRGAGL